MKSNMRRHMKTHDARDYEVATDNTNFVPMDPLVDVAELSTQTSRDDHLFPGRDGIVIPSRSSRVSDDKSPDASAENELVA